MNIPNEKLEELRSYATKAYWTNRWDEIYQEIVSKIKLNETRMQEFDVIMGQDSFGKTYLDQK